MHGDFTGYPIAFTRGFASMVNGRALGSSMNCRPACGAPRLTILSRLGVPCVEEAINRAKPYKAP
jgi:hypothetical protein